MSIRRVVIVHGYRAAPDSHWFDALRNELTADGITIDVPILPETSAPERAAWTAAARSAIGTPDDELAVVGHSLGAITALRALDDAPGAWTLGAFVAVSGFVAPLSTLPELNGFISGTPDVERTVRRTRHRAVFLSDHDTIVDPALTAELGVLLRAESTVIPGAGHFLGSEGVTRFPQLAELLRSV